MTCPKVLQLVGGAGRIQTRREGTNQRWILGLLCSQEGVNKDVNKWANTPFSGLVSLE